MTATRSLRIGDAERDEAVSALGEHYAAGRITKDEYDERAGQVSAARFDADLDPLFADLPRSRGTVETASAAAPERRPRFPARRRRGLFFLAPVMALAVGGMLFLVISAAPWMLFVLFGLWMFGGFGGHRGHRAALEHHAAMRERAWTRRQAWMEHRAAMGRRPC